MTAEELADRLGAKHSSPTVWAANCPAHNDTDPSLSIAVGETGGVVLYCHAGCTTIDILTKLGLTMVDLAPPKMNGEAHTTYRYTDEAGALLFEVVRKPGKKFLQRRPDGMGGWIWKMDDTRRVLYHLPRVIKAVANDVTVFLCEGEKDADRIIAEGYCATTSPMGAGKWGKVAEHAREVLKDADVIVIRDMDDPGLLHATEIMASLQGVARSVMMVEPAEGKDASDHLAAGRTIDEFVEVGVTSDDDLVSLDDLLDSEEEPYAWLVPGIVEEMDRIILTGLEGGGKSTFCRQFGAQVSIGIHPFGGEAFAPLRVLYIDCENSRRQVRRKADKLRKRRGSLMKFKFRPDGVDLTIVEHIAWLEDKIKQWQPQLLIIGPIYKMAGGDPKDEQNAKAVSAVLDELRVRHNFALLIEAHSPYADGSKSKRPIRPYGASLWSRWPEFGLHLANDGAIQHWRGPRDEREWPAKLKRGEEWPWEVEIGHDVETPGWEGPTKCMQSVVDFFRTTGTTEYSGNQLYASLKAVGAPYHRATIGQAAERLVIDGLLVVRVGARNSRLYSNNTNPSQQTTHHGESTNDDEF